MSSKAKGAWLVQALVQGTAQQFDDIHNALSAGIFVARRPAKSNQETHMAGDAVADRAKARKIDEESFLKQRG